MHGDQTIHLKPFVKGAATLARTIVRTRDEPHYLCLGTHELTVVEGLVREPVTVNDFLARHLAGHEGLHFKDAVTLLVTLYEAELLDGGSQDVRDKIRDLSARTTGGAVARVTRGIQGFARLLDLPLVEFEKISVHPALGAIGRALGSVPALGAYLVVVAMLGLAASQVLPQQDASFLLFEQPEMLLLRLLPVISVATSIMALLEMATLAGAGARFIGGSLRLTGLCIVRLEVNDRDALMLPRSRMITQHLFALIAPWVFAFLAWLAVEKNGIDSMGGLFAGAFAAIGVVRLCPLYRGPIVKVAEGFLAELDLLAKADHFLTRGLFTGLISRQSENRALHYVLIGLASLSMVWLYAVMLVFTDVMTEAVPHLWLLVTKLSEPVRAGVAALMLGGMGLGLLGSVVRLAWIPLSNLVAVADVPLSRARRSMGSFASKRIPVSAAVINFLKQIPVLAHLTDDDVGKLIRVMRFVAYARGQAVIRQGEEGSAFYIVADGRAQVVIEKANGEEEVVDVLEPGDSFGEIALIDKVRRTATVRAMTPLKTLVVGRAAFDGIFPEGSAVRLGLTQLLRKVKLIVEAQALSHLGPHQIRELAVACATVNFAKGEMLIEAGSVAECAYLVDSGHVKVIKDEKTDAAVAPVDPIAILGRGNLVGAIALIKDIRRTAHVEACEDVTALKIDKATFLRMCMANVFVAMLVSEMAEHQLTELKAG